jgi:hypothetical protein
MSDLSNLVHDRVANSTKVLLNPEGGASKASVGTQGAIAYALLDVANAIRELANRPDPHTRHLLDIAESLVDCLKDGDDRAAKFLAEQFKLEKDGLNFDQILAKLPPR